LVRVTGGFAYSARFRPLLLINTTMSCEIHRIGTELTEEYRHTSPSVIEEYVRKPIRMGGHEILEKTSYWLHRQFLASKTKSSSLGALWQILVNVPNKTRCYALCLQLRQSVDSYWIHVWPIREVGRVCQAAEEIAAYVERLNNAFQFVEVDRKDLRKSL